MSHTSDVAHRGSIDAEGLFQYIIYNAPPDPARLAEYAPLAGAVLKAAGGRFLTRGSAAVAYEAGITERAVIIAWDSVAQFVAFYEGDAYRAALAKLGPVERDVRVIEGG
jgi:uncharacterized protein (DUF1330 family)